MRILFPEFDINNTIFSICNPNYNILRISAGLANGGY